MWESYIKQNKNLRNRLNKNESNYKESKVYFMKNKYSKQKSYKKNERMKWGTKFLIKLKKSKKTLNIVIKDK